MHSLYTLERAVAIEMLTAVYSYSVKELVFFIDQCLLAVNELWNVQVLQCDAQNLSMREVGVLHLLKP